MEQGSAIHSPSKVNRTKLALAIAVAIAFVVAILGGLVYQNQQKYSNILYGLLGVLYMPGLTVSAVVGGALGVGGIHDPSLVLAGSVNFLLYGLGSYFFLKWAFKPKERTNRSVKE